MLQQHNENKQIHTSYSMIQQGNKFRHQHLINPQKSIKQISSFINDQNPRTPNKQNKHTQQQGFGFDHQQEHQVVIVKKQEPINQSTSLSKKFIPFRIKQPKLKLTFIAQKKQPEPLTSKIKKQYEIKSLEIKKGNQSNCKSTTINDIQNMVHNCVVKIKRNFVGDNIVYQNHCLEENKRTKFDIISSGGKIVYQLSRETSTYAHLALLKERATKIKSHLNLNHITTTNTSTNSFQHSPQPTTSQQKSKSFSSTTIKQIKNLLKNSSYSEQNKKSFLDYSHNQLLKKKLKDSFIQNKCRQNKSNQNRNKNNQDALIFDADFQSANLQFVSKINDIQTITKQTVQSTQKDETARKQYFNKQPMEQYNLYLRNDTNTHGHQNWFYFKVTNPSKNNKKVKFNVMNLKRTLNLVKDGQKIFCRTICPQKSQWFPCGQNIQMKQSKKDSINRTKFRSLSFQLTLNSQTQYQLSLLPPYTYSQLMYDLQKLKNKDHIKIQTLTYSLIGLAVPILTFTNFNYEQNNKQVIFISSRIHPGQTVASFMVKGFIQALSDVQNPEIQEFLNTTIVKIIPMINPDGVIFGNFRTNFLGYDLNRSFHTEDQITNPQVVALKQLGKKLKQTHGQKFSIFIDLHGHSSQKNIFSYGPDYQNGHQKFYKARLLPKLLNSKSPYFKYSSCNFKLQQYKMNTARGFFLNTLHIISFTIQSSYAIYQNQDGKNQLLTHRQWLSFGNTLCSSFELMQRLNKVQSIKNRTQLKRAISLTEQENMSLMNAIKKQIKKQEKNNKSKKNVEKQQDSDGQDQAQDLNSNERQQMQKKLVQNSMRNIVLPKVFKPSILYPTVTPKLFHIGQNITSSYKILYTRRNRYQSIKLPINDYISSVHGSQQLSLKPKARNIKLDRKIQF